MFTEEGELVVIYVTMKISVEFAKDIAKGKDVDDEEEVPQE